MVKAARGGLGGWRKVERTLAFLTADSGLNSRYDPLGLCRPLFAQFFVFKLSLAVRQKINMKTEASKHCAYFARRPRLEKAQTIHNRVIFFRNFLLPVID